MSAHRTLSRIPACMILACISLMLFSVPAGACRMYATIGSDRPNGMLYTNLVSDPNSLYNLSWLHTSGWGIGYYTDYGVSPTIARGQPAAHSDAQFTATVNAINSSEPQIVMAHIRYATSGCMGVPNPHPFYRIKIGKTWLFEHNGNANKDNLISLMSSSTYLADNPPNGSDMSACAYPPMDNVVGSEIYFLYLLKNIEENGWNVVNGVVAGIKAMIANSTSSINFVMSDGKTVWAFRRGVDTGHGLYYLDKSADGYAAVASEPPSSGQGWVAMSEYQLVVLQPGASPIFINDVRIYCPGDINGDNQVDAADLDKLAGNLGFNGGGDLDFDGDVDGADLAALIAAYGIACP
jgi:predicted glutamine amidotransferase